MKRLLSSLICKGKHHTNKQAIKVGYITPHEKLPYTKAMASTRLRVYDIIRYFKKIPSITAELYRSGRDYDVCIFQKYFDDPAYQLMQTLSNTSAKIILDINVNYLEKSDTIHVSEKQISEMMRFGGQVDGFIAASSFLCDLLKEKFPSKKAVYVPENINAQFFTVRKEHTQTSPTTLLYVGYAVKAKELLSIRSVLEKLGTQHDLELLFICDKDPRINITNIRSRFVKYDQKHIHKQLLAGDIKISPRNLNDPYNRTHTFTKIGYPMAVGIPVVAAPVDSYKGSPALLCATDIEWETALQKLIGDHHMRNELADQGIEYCMENFSIETIGKQYEAFLTDIVGGSL